jgi:hypothetical protein
VHAAPIKAACFIRTHVPVTPAVTMKLYRQIAIWKKVSEKEAIRYNLIEDLAGRKFAHQSMDFFRPSDTYGDILFLEKLFAERIMDDLDQRSWFDSIEDVIQDMDERFARGFRPSPKTA